MIGLWITLLAVILSLISSLFSRALIKSKGYSEKQVRRIFPLMFAAKLVFYNLLLMLLVNFF